MLSHSTNPSSSSSSPESNDPSNIASSNSNSSQQIPGIFSLDSILSTTTTTNAETSKIMSALCNDPSGLCLGSKGNIDTSRAGLYTKIMRLASQLDSAALSSNVISSSKTDPNASTPGNMSHTVAGGARINELRQPVSNLDMDLNESAGSPNNANNDTDSSSGVNVNPNRIANSSLSPIVSIETDRAAIFIKEYDGHTVVLRFPTSISAESTDPTNDGQTSMSTKQNKNNSNLRNEENKQI